jgi:hypothetical protein
MPGTVGGTRHAGHLSAQRYNFRPSQQNPPCPKCGKPMTLAYAERAYFYSNMDQLKYTCECGEAATNFSPR